MLTKHSVLRILRNPLVTIPPLVLILSLGWHQYTYAGRNFNLPDPHLNLLADSDFRSLDADQLPTGWQVTSSDTLGYTAASVAGYAGGSSLQLTVNNYHSGDLVLATPKVPLSPSNNTYLFKGYYRAGAPFALLVRSYFSNGSSSTQLAQVYPATGDTWTTTSDAFQATTNLVAVQILFRLYTNGSLTLNEPYLQPQPDVYIAPATKGTNILPNSQLTGDLAGDGYDAPAGWSTYQTGSSNTSFLYAQDTAGAYIQTKVNDYKNGQAKWQYTPQATIPGQPYSFSVTYRSNVSVPVVAEYVLQNGTRQDQTVATLPPADDWTTATTEFESPPQAVNMFISTPLEGDGTVATRGFSLIAPSETSASMWQPTVSVTFDNDWQTAYTNALPILQHYGYKATFYVNPATIETAGYMTASQLDTLAANGDEIGAHGYNDDDLTALNSTALSYQLQEGRNYLRAAGFSVSALSTPYGLSDAQVQYYARQYYSTVRGTEQGINTRQSFDPYNLKVLYVTNKTTAQTIADMIQTTKDENGWLILVYRQVGNTLSSEGSSGQDNITTAAFQKQISVLHDSGITVLPVTPAYKTLQGQ